jgi:hypothetical protein
VSIEMMISLFSFGGFGRFDANVSNISGVLKPPDVRSKFIVYN